MVNGLLQGEQDLQKLERIVWIDQENQWCYVVNVISPSFPYRLDIADIEQKIKSGELINATIDPFFIAEQEEELSEIEIQKRNFAWEIINYIYRTPDIFVAKWRANIIRNASSEYRVSEKTIRHYLKRYWARGMGKNSLLPDYGVKQKKDRVYKKKAGRPTVYPSSIKRETVNDEWKKLFRFSLEKYYFIKSKPSLKYAYQQMLKDYFSIEDIDTNYKVLNIMEAIPSFDQYYYWFRKWYKSEYSVLKREGIKEFLQNHRAITGSATEDAMGIGVYAVDGTIGDIYLVSSLDKNRVIGRPIIYLLVDIYSRCIAGISVSIENMSGDSLRTALANTFENKKEFCKRTLDLDIGDDEWPIHYLPHTLLADRGSELLSEQLTSIVENLNIKIQNTGKNRPELKGVCEGYFGLLQQHLLPFLPGAVQKDFNKRGVQDYRKNAVLNLNEYTRILVRCVIYYNRRFIKDYPLTKNMIEDKVPPIPIEIFKWGLKRGTGQLKTMTTDLIRGSVMPYANATCTAKGILFQGLHYSSSKALKEGWFTKARTHGSFKLQVQYDPQNMFEIYLREDRKTYEKCSLIDQYDMYGTAKMEELIDLRKTKRQNQSDYEQEALNGQVRLAQEIEVIVSKAKRGWKNSIY